MTTGHWLITDGGQFCAPDWVKSLPRKQETRIDEHGDFYLTEVVDADTPEGAAFFGWFNQTVNPRAVLHSTLDADYDDQIFINERRPF